MKTLLVVVLLVCCALRALADKERGCSLSLDGSKRLVLDRFVQGDGDNGVIMTDATFEAWIHPAKSTSGTIVQTGLIQMRSSPLTSQVLHYHNKQLMVVVYTASGTDNQARIYHTNTEVHPGRWTHVTMHISQSLNATIHINGEHAELEQYSFAGVADFPVDPPPRRFAIGGEFEGEIDEVKLWDSLRVPTMHVCDSTEGLVMYLPFNECSGNITADLGSSASCGRMRNATNGWGEGDMRRGGGGRGQWRHHAHHMHGEDGLHPVPFYIENMPQMVEERELPQPDGKRDHDGKHKDHEHDGKHDGGHDGKHDGDHHDGKQDGKHDGEHHDGKHDGEHHDGKHDGEHDGKHKHGGGEHHKCRGASITFGSPAPGASCATNFPPADINKQCPYSSFIRHHHHGSDASSSESSHSDDDSESSSDGDSESDSSDEASGMFWTNVFVASMVFAFVMFCCITKRKMRDATAATHQPLPTEEQQQQEFEGYPGNHPLAVAPQFVVNVADGDFATVVDVPLSFEEHQPFMMYPAEMGVYQQHAAPPFMYYMPQPVFYAPNAERVEGE